jgi:hypothetical protein
MLHKAASAYGSPPANREAGARNELAPDPRRAAAGCLRVPLGNEEKRAGEESKRHRDRLERKDGDVLIQDNQPARQELREGVMMVAGITLQRRGLG